MKAPLRIARPTDRLEQVARMYRDGLGLEIVARFTGHDGFDGIVLGAADLEYQIEFTSQSGHAVGRAPTQDHLLVFYLPDTEAWNAACVDMERAGFDPVSAWNPYWDRQGRTFEDPDGYRVVLQNANPPGR